MKTTRDASLSYEYSYQVLRGRFAVQAVSGPNQGAMSIALRAVPIGSTASPTASPSTTPAARRCEELDDPMLPYPDRALTIADGSRFSPAVRLIQDSLNYPAIRLPVRRRSLRIKTRAAVTQFQGTMTYPSTGESPQTPGRDSPRRQSSAQTAASSPPADRRYIGQPPSVPVS